MKMIKVCTGDFTLIDDDIEELVQDLFLHYSDGRVYYDHNRNSRNTLHRLVLGNPPPGMVIDHINNNPLDNRRANLRFATPQQNSFNRSKYNKGKTSSHYKGVHKRTFKNGKVKWRATLRHSGVTYHLGYHNTEEQAAHAYNQAAKKYFGEFANLNNIKKGEKHD